MKRVLVVVAHPDDETLMCGGTMWALATDMLALVKTVTFTDGVGSRGGSHIEGNRTRRWLQFSAAMQALGCKDHSSKDYEDQKLDAYPLLTLVQDLEREVAAFMPDTILTHSPRDLNRDHRIVTEAVMVATRPQPALAPIVVYGGETPSATEYGAPLHGAFAPTRFHRLSAAAFCRKLDALRLYVDEFRRHPHPRSHEMITALARVRGAAVGVPYAEAFEVLREVVWL